MSKQIVQILGPTGVGKSRVAVEFARKFSGEVISADALQVYKGFDIGTDKADQKTRSEISHHLIDIIDDCSQFHAWHFLQCSHQIAEDILARNRLPIVCGGTALYLRVQIRGIFEEVKDSGQVRKSLETELNRNGLENLWLELHRADPEYANKIGLNDRIRIIRALEIYRLNRIAPTALFRSNVTPFSNYTFHRIGLTLPREELYKTIDERVEQMIDRGLIEEVRELLTRYSPRCPPFKAIGYKEIVLYLNDRIDRQQAIDLIKQNTRRFAKRQLTWFRHEPDIHWYHPQAMGEMMAFLERTVWNKR